MKEDLARTLRAAPSLRFRNSALRSLLLAVAALLLCAQVAATQSTRDPAEPANLPGTLAAPAPGEVVRQSVLSPTPLTPNDQLRLAEYQLAERVQGRVIRNLLVYGSILSVIVAFIGFVGYAAVLDLASRRVESRLKDAIDKDVESLRRRANESLIAVELAAAAQKTLSERTQTELEEIRSRYAQLQNLSAQYETLHSEVVAVQSRVTNTIEAAAKTARRTEQLEDALVRSAAGKPTIVSTSFNGERTGGNLQGTNFGSEPGRLIIRIVADLQKVGSPELMHVWEMPPFEIPRSDIQAWSDSEIRFRVPSARTQQIHAFRDQIEPLLKERSADGKQFGFGYDFVVETASGSFDTGAGRKAALPPERTHVVVTPAEPPM